MSELNPTALPAFPKLDAEAFSKAIQPMYEQLIQQVTQAINHAPDGDIIDGCERQFYDLMNQFEQRLYQVAFQQRIDTAQADFSPSDPS